MTTQNESLAAANLSRLRDSLGSAALDRVRTMELIKRKRLKTSRDEDLRDRTGELLEGLVTRFDPELAGDADNRIEARALLVLGETGAGKSWTLRRFFAEHPSFPGYGRLKSDCPLITVSVKPPCTFLALGRQVAARTGYPIEGKLEAHAIWDRVYQRLQFRGIFGVHFDELHNFVRTANKNDRQEVQNIIKTLMNMTDWPVFVVVSGLPMLKEFVEEACEDRRRLRVVHFARLASPDDNAKIKAVLRALATVANLTLSKETVDFIVPRLMHAALYALGTCMELMHEAIDGVLRKGKRELDAIAFANAYAARTACHAAANPFLVGNWSSLDCSKVLMRDADTSIVRTGADPVGVAAASPGGTSR
ncbi:ATP-binding protein [Methylobacterium soli]|uniref:AAA family ATPase n=1 Tax=Methylobacterium soli TaxID=553447 RepID=A0A6L3SV47_9HYPH|nr:ATP-binding protein [Methylobacterium soli]KAB1076738.1 AAA family ATPase [Methylobacterium soli]GJE44146.1 hypothetical protein AEGHOMDF_3332 [Methylobacterium soli]